MTARKDIDVAKDEIERLLRAGMPRMEICRRLQCRYVTLFTRLKLWGLDHLKNPNRKGVPHPEARRSVEDYLVLNGPHIHTSRLRLKLVEAGLKIEICEVCNLKEWMGKLIHFELHHINGDRFDNRIENLQMICPMCHSMTENDTWRNVGAYRAEDLSSISFIPEPRLESARSKIKVKNPRIKIPPKTCMGCGTQIQQKSIRCIFCSVRAGFSSTKISWPGADELLQLLWSKPTKKIAQELGVSDSAVAERAIKLGLSKPPRGYWNKRQAGQTHEEAMTTYLSSTLS